MSKSLATDTLNQVRGLTTQSIDLGAARARELIAVGGAELRCNADFRESGVVAELDHLVASLKFWQVGKPPGLRSLRRMRRRSPAGRRPVPPADLGQASGLAGPVPGRSPGATRRP